MERIIQILMRRDKVTYDEAKDLVEEVKDMMEDCNYDPEECEDIFMSELGLELDYLTELFLIYEKELFICGLIKNARIVDMKWNLIGMNKQKEIKNLYKYFHHIQIEIHSKLTLK